MIYGCVLGGQRQSASRFDTTKISALQLRFLKEFFLLNVEKYYTVIVKKETMLL